MCFFSRRKVPHLTPRFQAEAPVTHHGLVDHLILEMGRTTDEVIMNMLRDSRDSSNRTQRWLAEQRAADVAWQIAYRRKEAERLEKQYPGYREEFNRQRAAVGLPPI